MEVSVKKCSICNESKATIDFYKDKKQPLGLRSACKECDKKRKKENKQKKTLKRERESEIEHDSKKLKSETSEQTLTETAESSEDLRDQEGTFQVETNYPEFPWQEKFEPGKHYSTFITASRNSGKTTMLKHLWPFFKSRFDIIIFFTNSLQAAIYKEFLDTEDRKTAFTMYHPGILKDLDVLQKLTENALHIAIFFDDCSDLSFVKNSDDILQLFIRGRNKNHSIFYSTQSPIFINRNCRANTDFLLMMRCRTPAMKETVIKEFLYDIVPVPKVITKKSDKFKYYSDWITKNTLDRRMVILDYLNDDEVYQYRAKIN